MDATLEDAPVSIAIRISYIQCRDVGQQIEISPVEPTFWK
jgi:hypothetical protein